jgi:hypothetical protein
MKGAALGEHANRSDQFARARLRCLSMMSFVFASPFREEPQHTTQQCRGELSSNTPRTKRAMCLDKCIVRRAKNAASFRTHAVPSHNFAFAKGQLLSLLTVDTNLPLRVVPDPPADRSSGGLSDGV